MKLNFLLTGIILALLGTLNSSLNLIKFTIFNYTIHFYLFAAAAFFIATSFIFKNQFITKEEKKIQEIVGNIEKKETKKKNQKKLGFGIWLFIFIVMFSATYFFFPNQVENILKNIPFLYSIFLFFKTNIIMRTYLGLFVTFSVGSLFFIFVPLEITYLYFISVLNPAISLVIVIVAVFLGLSMNYFLGTLFSKKIQKDAKYEKTIKWIAKYGGIILILFYFTPFPVQILTFILGGLKYPYKKFALYLIPAIFLKYVALSVFGMYIINYFSGLIGPLI